MPDKVQNIITRWLSDTTQLVKGNEKAVKSTTQSVNKIDKVFKKAAISVGAFFSAQAALAVFKDTKQTIQEFEVQLSGLSSITGLTGSSLQDLGSKAIEMSTEFGTSAAEILDGFALVGSAIPELLESGDALAEVTKQADILSKASGLTLQEAIGALTKSMNQFGVGAESAAMFTDILATSQQKGTARVDALSLSLKNSGSAAKAVGLSFEDTNAVLQAMAKGGLEGAEAGTALRGILIKLANTGRKDLNPAFNSFSDILKTLDKEIGGSLPKATKLFEEANASVALSLIEQRKVVEDLTGALNDQGSALDQASTNTDNLSGMLAIAAATWDSFVLSVDSGGGVLSNVMKGFVSTITEIVEILKDINDGTITTFAEFNRASDLAVTNTGRIIREMERLEKTSNEAFNSDNNIDGYNLAIERLQIGVTRLQTLQKDESTTAKERGRFFAQEKVLTDELAVLKERLAFAQKANIELAELELFLSGEKSTATEKEIITLAVLEKQLKEAQKSRKPIVEGDIAARDANTKLIVGLKKRIEFFKIENKVNKDLEKTRKKAARDIIDLQIALAEDGSQKQIEIAKVTAQRRIEDAKGTDEQIAQQTIFIALKLAKDIAAIQKQARIDRFEAEITLRQMIAADDLSEESEQAEKDSIEILKIDRKATDERIALKKKRLKGDTGTEQEFQNELRNIEIRAIEARLKLATDDLDERRRLQEQLLELKQQEQDGLTVIEKKGQKDRESILKDSLKIVSQVGQAILQDQINKIDESIAAQQRRVDDITKIAGRGNAEQLQLEEERLAQLHKAREQAVNKQRQLAALEIAINSAVAVAQAIPAIIRGFSEGGLIGGIAQAVALAATVASSVIAVKSALSNVPAFAKGTEYVTGKGSGSSDSINARLSKGERIVTASENKKLGGIKNKDLAKYAIAGQALHDGSISSRAYGSPGASQGGSNSGVEKRLESVENAINNLRLTTRFNGRDIDATLAKRNGLKERRKKLLN